jgi:hypothetical protein
MHDKRNAQVLTKLQRSNSGTAILGKYDSNVVPPKEVPQNYLPNRIQSVTLQDALQALFENFVFIVGRLKTIAIADGNGKLLQEADGGG